MQNEEKEAFLPHGQSAKTFDYKSLIEKVSEHGDLVILGIKGSCKTTLMMHLARTLREDAQNHVIIFETFPKWIHEFDAIPYMTIRDSDVQLKEELPYLEENGSIIQWSKDYQIMNAEDVVQCLKENKDAIFTIEAEDMEKISAFMTFVIYQIYRKQYLRAKANCLEKVNERFWFLTEESHNLLDSTVIAKKTFNKLRKIQNEFRNLKMHMVCVALRLQDLSPKIRAKMSILLARVSLDDYQLKVRNLLRNSNYRNEITALEKGKFIFPETDNILEVKPFQQNGKPTEWVKPMPKTEPKKSILLKIPFINRLYKQHLKERVEMQKQTSAKPTTTTEDYQQQDDLGDEEEDLDTETFEEEIFGEDEE